MANNDPIQNPNFNPGQNPGPNFSPAQISAPPQFNQSFNQPVAVTAPPFQNQNQFQNPTPSQFQNQNPQANVPNLAPPIQTQNFSNQNNLQNNPQNQFQNNQPKPQYQPQMQPQMQPQTQLQPQMQNQAPVRPQLQQPQIQAPEPQAYNLNDPNYYNPNPGFDLGFGQDQSAAAVAPVGPNMFNQFTTRLKTASKHKRFDSLRKNWWIALSGLILLVLIVSAAFVYLGGSGSPSSDYTRVFGKVSSDASVPSGSLGTWKINVDNRENVTLDKVKLFLDFDRTFTFSRSPLNTPDAAQEGYPYGSVYSIGQLKPFGIGGSSALISIEGNLVGDLDTEAITGGFLEYQPVGASQKYRIILEKAITKIGAPELTIDVSAPPTIKNGVESDLYIDFKNLSDKNLSNLRIKLNYPANNGFKYIASQLQLSKTSDVKTQPDQGDNIWMIDELPRFTPQQLKVRGQFVGVPGELKKLEAEIAVKNNQTGDYKVLAKKAISISITGEVVQVRTFLDGRQDYKFFNPGDTVTLKVAYKNTSTRNLEDVKILAWIDDTADILDLSTVAFTGGDRGNFNNGKLEWRQQGAPQLQLIPPNGSGELSFSVKVKEGKNFLSGKPQSQFTLRPRAIFNAIATESVAVVGDEYKALGDLKFAAKSERQVKIQPNKNDSNLSQVDYTQLQVGVPASYIITWNLSNAQNQVNRVKVSTKSGLPPTVWDQTSVLPITENSKISFDKVTGDIVWDAGDLPGYTGLSLPAKSVSFVLTFTPSEPQISSGVDLYSEVKVEGVDDFTSQSYQLKASRANVR